MKRLAATLLALGLLASGAASAQSSRYYGTDGQDAYASRYDYARVIRVDPVIDGGYRTTGVQQNCQYREADDVYARDTYRTDGYRDDGYGYPDDHRDGYYGDRRYPTGGSESGRTVATVIGGIAGAVLGSRIGDGSGRYVGTAVGSMVGGMAGRSIYDSAQRDRQVQRGQVRVCDPVQVNGSRHDDDYDGRVSGYDVTYEYGNRIYHTRTDHHPGDRIRVRVDVRPE